MVEDVSVAPDRESIVYSANTGSTPGDDDRRHVFRVDLSSASITPLTGGESSEWQPVALADDAAAFDRATAQQPPLLTMLSSGGAQRVLDAGMLPSDFPSSQLVKPREVSFHAADGWLIHGQLFLPRGGGKHPAVVFVHGGPERQMLLTWHYMDYYSNSYAVNQVLASRGFVVLSVNYRTGIGYGHDFNFPRALGPDRRVGVSRRRRRRALSAAPCRASIARTHRNLGRLVRRLPHGPRASEEFRHLQGGRRFSRRARLVVRYRQSALGLHAAEALSTIQHEERS